MTKPVYITIGGNKRRLRYDINAAAEMEEMMGGKSLLYVMANPQAAGFAALRVLLWGGLKHAEKGLTLQRAGLLMQEYLETGGSLGELAAKIGEAIKASKIMGESLAGEEDAQAELDEGNG